MPVRIFKHVSRRAIGLVSSRDVMWCFFGSGIIRIFSHEFGTVPVDKQALRRASMADKPGVSRAHMTPIFNLVGPVETLSLLEFM